MGGGGKGTGVWRAPDEQAQEYGDDQHLSMWRLHQGQGHSRCRTAVALLRDDQLSAQQPLNSRSRRPAEAKGPRSWSAQ